MPLTAALTLGAVSIPTAAIVDGRVLTRLAARDISTEVRRATGLDRAHHLELSLAEVAPHGATPRGTVIANERRMVRKRSNPTVKLRF